jgi:hypothetical protein
LAERLDSLCFPAIREDSVQGAHEVGERAPVLNWVKIGRSDILEGEVTVPIEITKPPCLQSAKWAFTIE